jgi:hypothetical protein
MHPANFRQSSVLFLVLASGLAFMGCSGKNEATVKTPVPYFGQALAGETPVPFAAEKLAALSPWVEATAFSPDGTLFFAAVGAADWSTSKLYLSTYVNGTWTPLVEPPFLADFAVSTEAVFLADGKTLTFTGKKGTEPEHLWSVSYAKGTWGTPVALPAPINDGANTWRGSYMTDGTFYFGSERLDPVNGIMGIYKGVKDASQNWTVELVGAPITTEVYECDPCIAPDGRFIIFASYRDGLTSDLYVSFRKTDGGWGDAINLGPDFNMTRNSVGNGVQEYGAHLSPDGKYLFYTRHTTNGTLKGAQIMWVAVSAVDKLKS